jgi:hypothetical protein
MSDARSFNRNLVFIAGGIIALCAYQLMLTATRTDNWRGAWFSLVHVVIVAVGTVLALRKVG